MSAPLQDFIVELSGFAKSAEQTLTEIEKDTEAHRHQFERFARQMLTIRGTSEQLELAHIARLAKLGEELAVKAHEAKTRGQVRKCVGALWDAMTTIKYLVVHPADATTEEQDILVNRLEMTLKGLGGARETVNADEIDALLRGRAGS